MLTVRVDAAVAVYEYQRSGPPPFAHGHAVALAVAVVVSKASEPGLSVVAVAHSSFCARADELESRIAQMAVPSWGKGSVIVRIAEGGESQPGLVGIAPYPMGDILLGKWGRLRPDGVVGLASIYTVYGGGARAGPPWGEVDDSKLAW